MNSNGKGRQTSYLAHEVPEAAGKLSDTQFAALHLLHYVQLLWSRWIIIGLATVAAGLGYGLITKYVLVKYYRAQALIAPISSSSGGLGSMSGAGDMMDSMGGGLMSLFNLASGGDSASVAERYLSIMNSYAFTTDLIKRYHLERKIVDSHSKNAPTVTRWQLHRAILSRFSAEYNYRSGNLELYFQDPDPQDAQRILGYYLDSLRDKLRNEEVQSALAAATSLQEEIRKTSDALLQTQLYELMARQVQREKVAQVQADFAFKVIEPPVVPDNYYAPSARKNATLAAALTFVLFCGWYIASDFIKRARTRLADIQQTETVEQPQPSEPQTGEVAESSPRPVRTLRPRA